ncbi:cytochrome c3 family protein [Inmirania thermothiophila]|uniref:Putative CXXCH cytochrome family protein n=1 Tax=Inmirania thermothiophila TaxID=1750597 RepID=A0A3N1YCQ4_9GAMM|nr:cytochrome c3 family protein [Inmirania thermothiophila]ROR35177.1 putative CXXCH cytochrome family protein [Inmirania thermothiophila]
MTERAGKRHGWRAAALAAALALLAPWGGWAGVENTKHNLVRGTPQQGPALCVFCHTPQGHGGRAQEPRWMRVPAEQAGAGMSFLTYDSLGRSAVGRDVAVGSVSMACLSCHDQTQAPEVSPQDSHPFGVPYRGEVIDPARRAEIMSEISQFTPFRPARFLKNLSGFRRADFSIIDAVPVWWVDTGEPGRQRTDVQLYSRILNENEAVPFVECASCHDPHSETRLFLRVENDQSTLCRACHADW